MRELEYSPMLEETSGLARTSSRNAWKHRKGYEKVIWIFKRFYKGRSVSWGNMWCQFDMYDAWELIK